MELRNQGSREVITATPRILESLIRISESLAKMELRETVVASDVHEAVRLLKAATYAAAVDPETGEGLWWHWKGHVGRPHRLGAAYCGCECWQAQAHEGLESLFVGFLKLFNGFSCLPGPGVALARAHDREG